MIEEGSDPAPTPRGQTPLRPLGVRPRSDHLGVRPRSDHPGVRPRSGTSGSDPAPTPGVRPRSDHLGVRPRSGTPLWHLVAVDPIAPIADSCCFRPRLLTQSPTAVRSKSSGAHRPAARVVPTPSGPVHAGVTGRRRAGGCRMLPKRSSLNRRQFFARSAAAAGATSIGGGLFDALVARSAYAGEPQGRGRAGVGYGPLRPAGEDLALPAGFQYRVISNEGDPMDDGFPTPKAMDGMAAFPRPNGNILLVRNHEDGQAGSTLRPRPAGSTSTSAGILARSPGDALRAARLCIRRLCRGWNDDTRSRAARTAPARAASTGASSAPCGIAPGG